MDPNNLPPSRASLMRACLFGCVAVASVLLVLWLKSSGILLAFLLFVLVHFFVKQPPVTSEADALRTSIRLSAEDIGDILADYDDFLHSPDTDRIADRQLHRPALADPDCDDPLLEEFFFSAQSARRFMHRLEARLASDLSVAQLESLLAVTDRRAVELQQSWATARRVAARLGPDYQSLTDDRYSRPEFSGESRQLPPNEDDAGTQSPGDDLPPETGSKDNNT